MRTENYNIKNAKTGTTFLGFNIIFPFDITAIDFKMDVKFQNGKLANRYEVGKGLTKVNSNTLRFDKQIIKLQNDTYEYDILSIENDGDKFRYLAGKWTIEKTITKP